MWARRAAESFCRPSCPHKTPAPNSCPRRDSAAWHPH
ncbi:MAG: hypothetical protein JOZ18_11425 [Chloroflexi bacterium]|nr:hypothetical protein [Chloroflexota bacterium]